MTNVLIEGFDLAPAPASPDTITGFQWIITGNGGGVVSDGVTNPGNNGSPVITGARSFCMKRAPSYGRLARAISSNDVYFGFACIPIVLVWPAFVWGVGIKGTTESVYVWYDNSGYIVISRGNTRMGTSAERISTGLKSYIEAHITPTTYEVCLNGVVVLSGTMASIGNMTEFGINRPAVSGSDAIAMLDDIYLNTAEGDQNNSYWGETSVLTVFPDSDEMPEDWTTVGTETAFDALNNLPATATQYIETDTAGHVNRQGFAALPPDVFQIFTTEVVFRAQKTTVGAAEVSAALIQNGTKTEGAPHILLENTYAWNRTQFPLDPSTGEPWNVQTFNPSLELKRTT